MAAVLTIDPALAEEAVFLWMSRGAAGAAHSGAWSREREALYALPPGVERERAFERHARAWFERLALAAPIADALRAVPRAAERLVALEVRRAVRAKDEGSELYGARGASPSEASARMVLAATSERFLDARELAALAARELGYAEDALDPAFGLEPDRVERSADDEGRVELIRDRFRVLWEARVAGKIARRADPGAVAPAPAPRFAAAFGRGADPAALAELHRRAWSGELSTHRALVERAIAGAERVVAPA